MIQSKVAVPKKHFFLVINRREQFFQSTMFHESSCGQPFLNGYAISQRSSCNHKLYISDVFDRYFYLRRIFISDVLSLFQETTCSGLVFLKGIVFLLNALVVIPFFKGIELIRNSSCSHPFDEWLFFYYKRVIAATHSFKFTVFLQNRNCSKEIS